MVKQGLILLLMLSLSTQVNALKTGTDSLSLEYEYIPGEANFDLIQDRIKCIEKTIPLVYNTRVHAFVNYFTNKDRAYTKSVLQKKDVYFPLFEKYLAKYGLPDELKYLSIVESGLNPVAKSRVGAVGLWQFMPATGRSFGLHTDWYLDERIDPEKSTEAACKFLSQLYNMFGDWELAIAAYNTGPGNVRRAIRRSGYKKTFWEIYPYLYRETRSYLPQFTAIIYTLNYAEEHNLFVEEIDYAIETDTIMVSNYIHLETLANQLNLCKDELESVNPSLKHGVVPTKNKQLALNIPIQAIDDLKANRNVMLDSASIIGKKKIEYLARYAPGSTYGKKQLTHRVRSGDVLGTIAQRYNVKISDLRRWNNIRGNLIKVGQRLVVWQKPGYIAKNTVQKPVIEKLPNGSKTYMVQPGDTLWDISRKFDGLSIDKIKKMNELESHKIKPGQRLIIGD